MHGMCQVRSSAPCRRIGGCSFRASEQESAVSAQPPGSGLSTETRNGSDRRLASPKAPACGLPRFTSPPAHPGASALSSPRWFAQSPHAGIRSLGVSHHVSPRAEIGIHPRQAQKRSRNRIHLIRRQPLTKFANPFAYSEKPACGHRMCCSDLPRLHSPFRLVSPPGPWSLKFGPFLELGSWNLELSSPCVSAFLASLR